MTLTTTRGCRRRVSRPRWSFARVSGHECDFGLSTHERSSGQAAIQRGSGFMVRLTRAATVERLGGRSASSREDALGGAVRAVRSVDWSASTCWGKRNDTTGNPALFTVQSSSPAIGGSHTQQQQHGEQAERARLSRLQTPQTTSPAENNLSRTSG